MSGKLLEGGGEISGGTSDQIVSGISQTKGEELKKPEQRQQQQQRICFITANTIRKLWTAVNSLKQAKAAPNTANVCQRAVKMYTWKPDDTATKLADCSDVGLLVRKVDPATNQELYFVPEDNAIEQEHDRFCFECHDAGTVEPCSSCFRVYHQSCKSGAGTPFLCNACQLLLSPTDVNREALQKQLESMLAYANTRGGPNFNAIPNTHSVASIEHHRLLVARPVDLTVMRGKVAKGEYANAGQFITDFKLLVHNMTILYGKESNLANLSRDLLIQIRAEIETVDGVGGGDDEELLSTPGSKQGIKGGKRKQDLNADPDPSPTKRGRKKSELIGADAGSSQGRSSSKHSSVSVQTEQAKIVLPTGGVSTNCNCDSKYRQLIIDMQQQWLLEYKQEREKCLTELAEKLHKEFLTDQDKLRSEMLNQFKQDLEQTKKDLDVRYSQQLKQDIQKQVEKHKRMISETKKKQWCWQCEAEAIYHCCWNTAYCSVECQQQHWPVHRKSCRRKKQEQQR